MFGGGCPSVQLRSESRLIGGIELLDHLLAISAYISTYTFQPMSCEYIMNGRHGGKTPCENPPLKFQDPGRDHLVIGHLFINVDLILPVEITQVGLISNRSRDASLECWSEEALSSLSNEAEVSLDL